MSAADTSLPAATDTSPRHHVDTTAKLVRMVNQIALNLVHDKDPVTAIVEHIHAFWTVRMQQQLFAHGTADLDPVGAAAVARLAAMERDAR